MVFAPPAHPDLDDTPVHVWWGISQPDDFEEVSAAVLSADEMLRASRFYHARDRQRYIAARRFLRQVLSCYTKVEPERLQFAYGVHGKPEIRGSATDVEFNLSHTRDAVAVAVSRSRKVGIDIEYSGAQRNTEAIAQSFFTVREQQQINRLPVQDHDAAFLALWTRKEALLKACGAGLAAPLDDVSITPRTFDRLDEPASASLGGQFWSVCNLDLQPDLVCALAVQGCACPTHIVNAFDLRRADAA